MYPELYLSSFVDTAREAKTCTDAAHRVLCVNEVSCTVAFRLPHTCRTDIEVRKMQTDGEQGDGSRVVIGYGQPNPRVPALPMVRALLLNPE